MTQYITLLVCSLNSSHTHISDYHLVSVFLCTFHIYIFRSSAGWFGWFCSRDDGRGECVFFKLMVGQWAF